MGTNRASTLLLLGAVLALGACASQTSSNPGRMVSEDIAQNHIIQVNKERRNIDLRTDGRGRIEIAEGGWTAIVTDYTRRGHGKLMVSGSRADVASSSKALLSAGARLDDLFLDISRLQGATNLSVSFGVYQATPPVCGQWSSDNQPGLRNPWNAHSTEFGCANQRNLAIMLSDPRDLMRRRGMEGPYSSTPTIGRATEYGTYTSPKANLPSLPAMERGSVAEE